ncbi:MAG: phosphate ABC transporter substrate-binding protein [Lachnospiraceae bacterium]|nr:phosphate ABC transporter substrate-binding protein [Lachnospiraceae bacterium]
MRIKKLLATAALAAMTFSLVACGGSNDKDTSDTSTSAEGTITITGSTSVEPIVNAMKTEYEALNPDVTIQYTGNGSSAGIQDTINDVNNIGASSRELTDDEKEGLEETVFAYDGIAIAVNPANDVKNITLEQLQKIYSGEITNWKELGGKDAEIYVVSREESSGTRSAFEELIKLEETDGLTSSAAVSEGNGPVQLAVAKNENAIGYVSFAYIDETVKQLTVEGVEGTVENVKNSTYPLSRPFLFVVKSDSDNELVDEFLEFAVSEDGQKCVTDNNGITVAEEEAAEAAQE